MNKKENVHWKDCLNRCIFVPLWMQLIEKKISSYLMNAMFGLIPTKLNILSLHIAWWYINLTSVLVLIFQIETFAIIKDVTCHTHTHTHTLSFILLYFIVSVDRWFSCLNGYTCHFWSIYSLLFVWAKASLWRPYFDL